MTLPLSNRRPLNILQVGSAFGGWGGAEIHLLNLSEQLARRGHRVTVACRPGKFVEQESQKRGLATFALTMRSQNNWLEAPVLWKRLKQGRYDVVHVHWSLDYLVPALLAKWASVPVVLMSHHSPHPFKSNLRRHIFRRVVFNKIIALSESVRQMLVQTQAIPPEKVVTIHHGTDPQAFRDTLSCLAVRTEWGIAPNAFVVGIAGRIAKEKGIAVLINAFQILQQQGDTKAHLVLVGSGPQEAEYRELAQSASLSHRVTFAGFRSDAGNAINALDVLVLASTWAEPCAAVVQQAMALSKPVIGTNTGGTPEMIAGGETGLLVPPGDSAALAAALAQVRDMSHAARQAMGQAGRIRVEQLFTLKGMVDKIEALYYSEYETAAGKAAV